MSGSVAFTIISFIGVTVAVFYALARSVRKDTESFANSLEKAKDFSPTYSYMSMWGPLSLALDSERMKLAIVPKGGIPFILERTEILAVEVLRDGTSVQKTNRGGQLTGAAVGAVLLGPVGLLLGGLSGSKRTEEKLTNLSLRIFTSYMEAPFLDIVFFQSQGSNPQDFTAKQAATDLTTWDGRLRALLSH